MWNHCPGISLSPLRHDRNDTGLCLYHCGTFSLLAGTLTPLNGPGLRIAWCCLGDRVRCYRVFESSDLWGCFMFCFVFGLSPPSSQPAEGEKVESVLNCGLVRGHAYGITAVKKVRLSERLLGQSQGQGQGQGGTTRLLMVRMRNPWGTADWTGDWSQG